MRVAHLLPISAIGGTEVGQLRVMMAAQKAGIDSLVLHPDDVSVVGKYFPECRIQRLLFARSPDRV